MPFACPVDIEGKPLETRLEECNAQLQLVEDSVICLEVGEDRRGRCVSRHERSHVLVVGDDFLLKGIQKRRTTEGGLADILAMVALVSSGIYFRISKPLPWQTSKQPSDHLRLSRI